MSFSRRVCVTTTARPLPAHAVLQGREVSNAVVRDARRKIEMASERYSTLAQRQLNRAWVLGIVIYLHVASVRVLRCFFGDDSARAIILLPQD